jgi:hypothetical protein
MDKPTDSEHVQAAGYQGGDEMNAPAINRKQRRQAKAKLDKASPVTLPVLQNTEGRYVPPEHSFCAALRPEGKRYGKVYKTVVDQTSDRRIITRYCFCRWCANSDEYNGVATYKDVTITKLLPRS